MPDGIYNTHLFGDYRGIKLLKPLGDYFLNVTDKELVGIDSREIDLSFKEQYADTNSK